VHLTRSESNNGASEKDTHDTSRPHVSQASEHGAFPAACPETAPGHLENEGATSETGVGSAHSSSSRAAGGHSGRQRPPCGFSAGKMCVSQPATRFLRGVVVFYLRRGKHPEMAEMVYGDGFQVLRPLCLCLNPFRFRGAAGLPFVDPGSPQLVTHQTPARTENGRRTRCYDRKRALAPPPAPTHRQQMSH
jgi:hypothetical protein